MSVYNLKPWIEVVKLHPDVESGSLTESIFAIDLGAIAVADSSAPKVYRDPDAFFAATYVTSDLYKLLEEVLASLAGQGSYNRVLKLRSPFGGGKSHTLASLLHAARSRKSLNQIPRCKGLSDPGPVDVAVFDGEKFTATGDKDVDGGQKVHTMWGWLAWQLGPKAYEVVRKHDQGRVSPQGDEIKAMLEATGRPVLLLLDEVLKYCEATGAVAVLDSTLQRQVLNFLHNLTVEVVKSRKAVLVYSLQWSHRQAMGNIALLQTLDTLTSRVDQVREPVRGDEVLGVIKQRLLAAQPSDAVAQEVAKEYSDVLAGFLRARAETPSAQQAAEDQAIEFRNRVQAAYPFHPALIDVMSERWTSVDGYQKTRGALRFLAACMHGLKKSGQGKALLGPAEIPVNDADALAALLKDLGGADQAYAPVVRSDLAGPNSRAKKIDDRIAKESPALANVRPAVRLATAILAYSFGGLKREEGSDALPPGITETELLAACIGPDLDSITASAVLGELRNTCLYLHYDGVRYCFKKDPNVTKLIEDAEQEVARDQDSVRDRIKELLEQRLAGKSDAIIWPATTQDLPDKEPRFLVGYMPLEFAGKTGAQQDEAARTMLSKYGDGPRQYRNGVALAIPDKKPIEALRRAVRYLMAVKRVEEKKNQHRLTKDQLDQLKERKGTEESAAESAFRQLYPAVWLPRVGSGGALDLEKIEVGGRPLQATGVHERVMELLTAVGTPKIHGTLKAVKVVSRMKLGESLGPGEPARLGTRTKDVLDAFFGFLEPPRITSEKVLQRALAEGVASGKFAYTTGVPVAGPDGRFQVAADKVVLGRSIGEDEIDLDDGFLMVPTAVPSSTPTPEAPSAAAAGPLSTSVTDASGGSPPQPGGATAGGGAKGREMRQAVRISLSATRDGVFKSFPALANLAEKSDGGKISIIVEGRAEAGYDPGWLRNAVQEPLDEANIDGLQIE